MRSGKVFRQSHTATVKLFCATTTGVPVLHSFGDKTCINRRQRNVAAIRSSSTFFCHNPLRAQKRTSFWKLCSDIVSYVNACFWYSVNSLMVRSVLGKDLAYRSSVIKSLDHGRGNYGCVSLSSSGVLIATLSSPCTIFCTMPAQLFTGLHDEPGQGTDPAEKITICVSWFLFHLHQFPFPVSSVAIQTTILAQTVAHRVASRSPHRCRSSTNSAYTYLWHYDA